MNLEQYCLTKLKLVTTTCFLLIASVVFSQEIKVSAELDTNSVQIGDQLQLMLQVEQQKDEFVKLPSLDQDSTYEKLEVLEVYPIDSIQLEGNRLAVQQNIKVTIWEQGQYQLPPLKFVSIKNGISDTLTARELLLTVGAPQIDTTQAIKDIAPVYNTPFNFAEFLDRFGLWVGLGLLAIAALVLLIFYFKKKEQQPHSILKRPKIPVHEQAIKALDNLKSKQLWEAGNYKEFYSELTDILKHYLEGRYGVSVLERTSHETMMALRPISDTDAEANQKLEKLFELADLAKFAKFTPLADENELSLKDAYLFIGLTRERSAKPTETATADKQA